MNKKELREIYLEKRKLLTSDDIEQYSEKIAERFFQTFDLEKIDFLHCFLPIARFNEIDTKLIFHQVWTAYSNIETVVPRVDFEKGEIENLVFTPVTELVENAWLIHEPIDRQLVESVKIDVVLIPLLCFDEEGFRVGYGKGFYDKFLNNCRADCLKIGLNYFPPIEKITDVEKFDVKLDYCLTPNKIWKF